MSSPSLRCISLGAGVQSTALALMAAHGLIGPMPDCAIFADTGDEPAAVYEHLRWLISGNVLPFPVYQVSRGQLSARLLAGDDMARVPFHVGAGGLATRQCTRNYKLRPIRHKVRELLGRPGRAYIAPGTVEQWIGISTDEAIRIKPSGVKFILNRHPLIELGMSRGGCIEWMLGQGYPRPPKSSCVYCPYRRDDQHIETRDTAPADWRHACDVDAALRLPANVARFHGELFVHRSRVPLAEAELKAGVDRGAADDFGQECEGMCGV